MPPELKTFFIAMSPILELRGAIPIALEVYKMPVLSALFFSVLGNLIPTIVFLSLLEPVSKFLSKHSRILEKFFNWLFAKTKRDHQKKFDRWERFALFLLVAVPLPFTGGWTASICAFLFNVKFKQAFPLIALGILSAGIIVALISLGIFQFI